VTSSNQNYFISPSPITATATSAFQNFVKIAVRLPQPTIDSSDSWYINAETQLTTSETLSPKIEEPARLHSFYFRVTALFDVFYFIFTKSL
jgi:hypothetical protein